MEKRTEAPGCSLQGTRYCRLLNMKSCEKCPVKSGSSPEDVMRDLDLYERLLPTGGIARLFLERDCQFCKGRDKNRRQGYAIIDMAHPEPQRIQPFLFGKRRAEIGTMVPVQLGICKKCRKTLLAIDYMPLLCVLLFGGAALALVEVDAIARALKRVAAYLPFLVWVGAVLLGALIGFLIAGGIERKAARRMYVDVLRHPALREMMAKGWFPIARKNRAKVMFSKSRMAKGLGTMADGEEEMV